MSASTRKANRASATRRFERAIAKAAVRRGVSLAVLLREQHHPIRYRLDGVPLHLLVRWPPGIGEARAQRILLGLPHAARLRELTPQQRDTFVFRLAAVERQLVSNRLEIP